MIEVVHVQRALTVSVRQIDIGNGTKTENSSKYEFSESYLLRKWDAEKFLAALLTDWAEHVNYDVSDFGYIKMGMRWCTLSLHDTWYIYMFLGFPFRFPIRRCIFRCTSSEERQSLDNSKLVWEFTWIKLGHLHCVVYVLCNKSATVKWTCPLSIHL